MSQETTTQAQLLIRQAYLAIRQGHRSEARQKAVEAARIAPDLEDPWLILAALATPQAAIAYLNKALEINPTSPRALRGMQWATKVELPVALISSQEPPTAEPTKPVPGVTAVTQPLSVVPIPQPEPAAQTPPLTQERLAPQKASLATQKQHGGSFLLAGAVMVVAILCLAVAAWAFWPSISTVFAKDSAAKPAALLAKPSLTPSLTPTRTSTSTPTATATATFTATPTSTDTPDPTKTFTPVPTQTPRPASNVSTPKEITGDQRWIDVDLAKQRAYAYEGSTLIRSFVISSGVARYPTVKGQFHIYVKYRSALMTGPGYYLPNVPWVMYFYQSYGLHGTYWHNNFGTPMSHGCVNFKTEDAKWVYEFTSIGTLVNIH